MKNLKIIIVTVLLSVCIGLTAEIVNGKFLTPPMGWNSWNEFGCKGITQDLYMEMADAMISSGLYDAGYEYINVDDCWQGGRGAGDYIKTTNDFTNNSMKTLADYIHSKGLKFGLYTCVGEYTCANVYEGSYGHEDKDIEQYAKWGVDYIKVDWCYTTPAQEAEPFNTYDKFRAAIDKHADIHPMVLSICNWGEGPPNQKAWDWGDLVGALWRTTKDIWPRT
jgi:alpha-galactosidase